MGIDPSVGYIEIESTKSWPHELFHRVALPGGLPQTPWPTNTDDAIRAGWRKDAAQECKPELGEAWLFGGERRADSSVTLYFSPRVGEDPGGLTGIEVDYYGAVVEGLIGSYVSPRQTVGNEVYHSVAVGFRDSTKYDLCDSKRPLVVEEDEKYVVVAPEMARLEVPTTEESPQLLDEWMEGSCLEGMGYHWLKSVIAGVKDLTYKANTVVPGEIDL